MVHDESLKPLFVVTGDLGCVLREMDAGQLRNRITGLKLGDEERITVLSVFGHSSMNIHPGIREASLTRVCTRLAQGNLEWNRTDVSAKLGLPKLQASAFQARPNPIAHLDGSRHPHSPCPTVMKIPACWRRLRLIERAIAAAAFPRARDVLCY